MPGCGRRRYLQIGRNMGIVGGVRRGPECRERHHGHEEPRGMTTMWFESKHTVATRTVRKLIQCGAGKPDRSYQSVRQSNCTYQIATHSLNEMKVISILETFSESGWMLRHRRLDHKSIHTFTSCFSWSNFLRVVPSVHDDCDRVVKDWMDVIHQRIQAKTKRTQHSPLPEPSLYAPTTGLGPLRRSAPTTCLIRFCADPPGPPPPLALDGPPAASVPP